MKNLVSLAMAYVIVGASVAIGAEVGKHIWTNKIATKLNK